MFRCRTSSDSVQSGANGAGPAEFLYPVSHLADEYFERDILGRWKHPIRPSLGKMAVRDGKPAAHRCDAADHCGARIPCIAGDVLRWTRRRFNYAVKRELVDAPCLGVRPRRCRVGIGRRAHKEESGYRHPLPVIAVDMLRDPHG